MRHLTMLSMGLAAACASADVPPLAGGVQAQRGQDSVVEHEAYPGGEIEPESAGDPHPVFERRNDPCAPFEPCATVEFRLSADDAWEGWLDGEPIGGPNQGVWTAEDIHETRLKSGWHVLVIQARDEHAVISGFIGVLSIDGEVEHATGDGSWLARPGPPLTGSSDPGFDDRAWGGAQRCSSREAKTWGTIWLADLHEAGGTWVWGKGCRQLGETTFRLHFEVP